MIKSVLAKVKKICELGVKVVKNGVKKLQQSMVDKSTPIIEKNINKPRVSQTMYVNQCLLSYSKNKTLIDSIISMDSKELEKFLKNKDNEIINIDSFGDNSDTKRFVLFPYAGGKQNYKQSQQITLNTILKENPEIDKYYDIFLGGFGSVYNSLPILMENGINEVYCNDINPSLINTFRQVQKNHKQVQRHLASIDLDYYKSFGDFYPQTKEEGKEWFNKVFEEFRQLEMDKKMNPRRAALFLYLIHNTHGGMTNFNMETKLNKLSFSYSKGARLKKVPFIINKVEIYHKILNLVKIEFKLRRYETVMKQIKNDQTCFILSDSPYVNYTEEESEEVGSCSFNYGVNDFNHKGLLRQLKNQIRDTW